MSSLVILAVLVFEILCGLIKVLRTTRHNIGHFGDVLPRQSLGLSTEETTSNTRELSNMKTK